MSQKSGGEAGPPPSAVLASGTIFASPMFTPPAFRAQHVQKFYKQTSPRQEGDSSSLKLRDPHMSVKIKQTKKTTKNGSTWN